MKVMISQPMRGKSNNQIRKERAKLVKALVNKGYEVVDTVYDGFIEGQGDNYAINCLAKSLEFMSQVDGVVFMPGWEDARGCRVEYMVAQEYSKFILLVDENYE